MVWWTEHYPWVLAGIGGALLIVFRRWATGRLFSGRRGKPEPRQEADQQVETGQAANATVKRARAGAIGATLLKLCLALSAGALIIATLLYAIALLKGVPVTALPETYLFAVAGPVAVLWLLIGAVYLLGRLAMRRRAKLHGVRVGPGVSCYQQSLILSADPAAALAQSRAALLALPGEPKLDSDGDALDEFVGRTGRSERSFGEIIRIRVQRSGLRRVAVEIRSRPAIWQLFDGGINAENVAGVVRSLEARAGQAEQPEPAAVEAPAREDEPLTGADWLALVYFLVLAGYTALMIALKELWPDDFAAWAGWLDRALLDPLRLLDHACPAGDPAAGPSIIAQLNILILPTLIAYSAYNTLEFRRKRDRMDTLNWILCLGSLVFLPLLVLMGCSTDWGEGLPQKYRALVGFMLEESTGAAVYALALVIFCNGASYLPALLLAKILGTGSKS